MDGKYTIVIRFLLNNTIYLTLMCELEDMSSYLYIFAKSNWSLLIKFSQQALHVKQVFHDLSATGFILLL